MTTRSNLKFIMDVDDDPAHPVPGSVPVPVPLPLPVPGPLPGPGPGPGPGSRSGSGLADTAATFTAPIAAANLNIRERDPSTTSTPALDGSYSSVSHLVTGSPSPSPSTRYPSHASSGYGPGHVLIDPRNPNHHHPDSHVAAPAPSVNQHGSRRGSSTQGSRSAAAPSSTSTSLFAPSPSPYQSVPVPVPVPVPGRSPILSSLGSAPVLPPPIDRRRSAESNDSMDQTGYGSAASSSSMGGSRNLQASNRPMPPHPTQGELPVKLTPITGRVSRAKKGIPVHTCEICKPAKTFTRAEHLRRHQLSHQTPRYACAYPGCDKAFHRPDLLARHQQRHEQEGLGENAESSLSGAGEERGKSTQSSRSPYNREAPVLPPVTSPDLCPTASTPASSNPGPGTPINPRAQAPYETQQLPSHVPHPYPHPHPHQHSHGDTSPTPQGSRNYTLSPTSHSPSFHTGPPGHAVPAHHGGFSSAIATYPHPHPHPHQPRTTPPMYELTRLDIPPPGLYHGDNSSPWASSASTSEVPTPVSDCRQPAGMWMSSPSHSHHVMPRTSPPGDVRSPAVTLDPGAAPAGLYVAGPNHHLVPSSHHPTYHHHQQLLDMAMPAYPSSASALASGHSAGHDSTLTMSSDPTSRSSHHQPNVHPLPPHHHHDSGSLLSAQSFGSPIHGHGRGDGPEVMLAPSTAIDPLLSLSRHKGLGVDVANSGLVGLGVGILDPRSDNFDGETGPEDMDTGTGNHATLLAALNLGGCGMAHRPARNNIPRYLDAYWSHVDGVMPIVHRATFEASPNEALTCAMAAVATQYLPGCDDRIQGSQLHEFAWAEVKAVADVSLSLPIMQAIVLCEYFARFRGRKAVTRPSSRFEAVYSSVSSHFFASASFVPGTSTSSLPFPSDTSSSSTISHSTNSPVLPFDSGGWSSPSVSSPSDDGGDLSSSASAASVSSASLPVTPVYTLDHNLSRSMYYHPHSPSALGLESSFATFPVHRSAGISLANFSSVLSGNVPVSVSPASSFHSSFPSQASYPSQISHFRRPRHSWSSLFDPRRYRPSSPSAQVPWHFPPQHQPFTTVQDYLPMLSNAQVMYSDSSFSGGPTTLGSDGLLPNEQGERWRSWIESESHRRLLTACFIIDSHTSIYQQQHRAQNFDPFRLRHIPLIGGSVSLWEAPSADMWADILASDPLAATPSFVSEVLASEDMEARPHFDRMALLGAEMLRLPRIQRGLRAEPPGNSPAISTGAGTGTDSDMEVEVEVDTDVETDSDSHPHQETEDRIDPGPRLGHHDTSHMEEHIAQLFGEPVSLTYLALHHTPLVDLLAVGGDSWLFTQKVLSSTAFREHQRRLSVWAGQHHPAATGNVNRGIKLSAARATHYASRAILAFVNREMDGVTPKAPRRLSNAPPASVLAPWSYDLSDYWAMYVCALIVWAFCHRAARGSSSPSLAAPSRTALSAPAADDEALRWLREVAEVPVDEAETSMTRMRQRGVAAPAAAAVVLGLVRRRLERDCVGKRSMLYSDALSVLRRLEADVQYRMC